MCTLNIYSNFIKSLLHFLSNIIANRLDSCLYARIRFFKILFFGWVGGGGEGRVQYNVIYLP